MIKVVGGVNSMRWEINVFIKPLGMLTARERERERERERLVCECVQDWITRIKAINCMGESA